MIGWALETFAAVNLLILIVLLARRPVAGLCGAGWAYALWLLPLVRIVLPPLPLPEAELSSFLSSTALIPAAADTAASLPSSGGPGQWVPLMLALWAGGAVAFLLWQLAAYRDFLASVSASLRSSYPPAYHGLPVLESRGVDGPVAIGLLDPRILVPMDFLSRYTPAEQRLALAQERVHHRRGDLWWNSLALLVLGFNWFNPLAWIAFRAFRADQELACDAAVARAAGPSERHDYAQALVKSASRPGLIAACPLNHADQLKRRLKMMNQHRSSRLRSLAGSAALLSLLAAGLGFSAPTYAQEEQAKERKMIKDVIIERIGKDGRKGILNGKSLAEFQAECGAGEKAESDVSSGDGEHRFRTRVIICGEGDTPENRQKLAAALDKARAELGAHERLTPEQRARAAEALAREVERLRREQAN